MPAAILPQDHSPPEIPAQLVQLFSNWHRLIQIRQEIPN